MAEFTIPAHFARNYHRDIELLAQQMTSRLQMCVRRSPDSTSGEFSYYNIMGPVELTELTTRFAKTEYAYPEHTSRVVGLRDFAKAVPVDQMDMDRMVGGGMSYYPAKYAMDLMAAVGRNRDRMIIEALGGPATERYGSAADSHATREVALPAAQKIASSNAGLTKAKFLAIKEKMAKAEVISLGKNQATGNPGGGKPYMVVSAEQLFDLLNAEETTSRDYANILALINGEIDNWLGIDIIQTELLPKTGNNRTCYAFTNKAIGENTVGSVMSEITRLPERNYMTQVYVRSKHDYVRILDNNVIEFICQEK